MAGKAFARVVEIFKEDLRNHHFRPGPRIRRVQGTADIWEITWAPGGRATWQFGEEVKAGEPHIIWRRIGTHEIFMEP